MEVVLRLFPKIRKKVKAKFSINMHCLVSITSCRRLTGPGLSIDDTVTLIWRVYQPLYVLLLFVVLIPANALAPPVTVNPEMCWTIDISLDLDAIMVQSIEIIRVKRRSRERWNGRGERNLVVFSTYVPGGKLAAYAWVIECRPRMPCSTIHTIGYRKSRNTAPITPKMTLFMGLPMTTQRRLIL